MLIPVTKPYLPNREKLNGYIDQIYSSGQLTNNGPLVGKLRKHFEDKFSSDNILLVANGTLALQIAYRVLLGSAAFKQKNIQAITTPFTFIATSNSLKWEGISPVFSDITEVDWCLNPERIQKKINNHTKLIVPVHVFGNTCNIDLIEEIASQNNLKTVYDASHSFAVNHHGKSILNYGDASIISLHATKLFHTVEGAILRFKHRTDFEKAKEVINFGFNQNREPQSLGINAKMNEVEAAFGLAAIDDIDDMIAERHKIASIYAKLLANNLNIEKINRSPNQSYLPVLFKSEAVALQILKRLARQKIEARRYFYPSLDTIEHLGSYSECFVSQRISNRILCLPIYSGLKLEEIQAICHQINDLG